MVAPEWLQSAFSILLLATPNVDLAAYTTDISVLEHLELEGPPDIVVLYAGGRDQTAHDQVGCIQALWADAHYLVLVDLGQQGASLEALGVEEILLKGSSAKQLADAIHRLS